MKDVIKGKGAENRGDVIEVVDIRLDKPNVIVNRDRQLGFRTRLQIIDDDNQVIGIVGKLLSKPASDKASGTGYQDSTLHGSGH